MTHTPLDSLSPPEQEQYLNILIAKLPPEHRQAVVDVAHWLATELPGNEHVTSSQVLQWIDDVRSRNEGRGNPAGTTILSFRRKQ